MIKYFFTFLVLLSHSLYSADSKRVLDSSSINSDAYLQRAEEIRTSTDDPRVKYQLLTQLRQESNDAIQKSHDDQIKGFIQFLAMKEQKIAELKAALAMRDQKIATLEAESASLSSLLAETKKPANTATALHE